MQSFKVCVSMFPLGIALVFLAPFAQASALTYNSTCLLQLAWFGPDPGTAPPLSISGTTTGSNSGCSLMASTESLNFTSSESDVIASVSGSVLTLSNSASGLGENDSDVHLATSGSEFLEGTSDASVQGSFTGTYELTGPNIANDTVLISFIRNSMESNCTDGGGCLTANVTQNGNTVHLSGYPPFDPSLSSIDFSQPFQLSINFQAQINNGCCILDAGGSLGAAVTFEVSDANGDPVSVNLAEVPQPGTFALMCAGVGLFVLGRVRHRGYQSVRL
jgi:hypothetical protein